ncbi:MAG: response regulator [Cyclobacteriaceae bacterium]
MKIMIADDHQMFTDGISYLIRENGWQVTGIATNGEELFRLLGKQASDLIILDIEMPGMDGVQAAKKLKQEHAEVKILVLSMHDENEFVRQMLNIGVEGYILKDSGKKVLIEAIETIGKGEKYYDKKVTETFLSNFSSPKKRNDDLSLREIDIIKLIAEEKTTSQIAEQLYLSKHTVETHRKNILLKLGLKNSAGLIKYAMRNRLIE